MKKLLLFFALLPFCAFSQHGVEATFNDVNIMGDVQNTPPHLAMSFSDSAVTLTMTVNNWAQITNASDSLFGITQIDNFTVDADTITFSKTGHYLIVTAITHVGGGGNDNLELRWVKNGVQCVKMESSASNQVDHIAVPIPCDVEATAGDEMWLEIRNITDNDDSEIHSGSVIITLIHF